jgi:hypothetical protein
VGRSAAVARYGIAGHASSRAGGADTTNAQLEGDDAATTATTPTTDQYFCLLRDLFFRKEK